MEAPNGDCPSYPCKEGAVLLGVMGPDGRVLFLDQRLLVDQDFIESANEIGPPEKRFRFSGTCLASGCTQWTGDRCGLIGRLIAVVPEAARVSSPRDCQIRSGCRWFRQEGETACNVCPLVVADNREEAIGPVRAQADSIQ